MVRIMILMLIILAVYTLTSRNLLHGILALSAFSLISAMLFYLLKAPDVAITEAAVGAGISTIIFVWAIKVTDKWDKS